MMNTLLDTLSSKDTWQEFHDYKQEKNQLTKKELKELDTFIAEEKYLKVTGTMSFSLPEKKEITKAGSSRKRIVYSYSEEETWVLKLLTYELYKYDDKISEHCYSFRRNLTAKNAFDRIRRIPDLDHKYVLKLDIHEYFNSIDVEQLIVILREVIADDPPLLDFLCTLLRQHKCIRNGEILEENRGAMAGVPLASFFANLYLRDLDQLMHDSHIPYFRYSDDMILFLEDSVQTEDYFQKIRSFLSSKGLTLNMEKYHVSPPEEPWEFLGFRYTRGKIDLAEMTIRKMQAKIRRKANRIYRNRTEKQISYDKAARSMIRHFDNLFYDLTGSGEYTWIRYYFPVITSAEGLQKIDQSMVQYLRYLYSGRHYKGNFKITYEHLKSLGYTSLVHEYYQWKKENQSLAEQNT